jgi:hypothetical protein
MPFPLCVMHGSKHALHAQAGNSASSQPKLKRRFGVNQRTRWDLFIKRSRGYKVSLPDWSASAWRGGSVSLKEQRPQRRLKQSHHQAWSHQLKSAKLIYSKVILKVQSHQIFDFLSVVENYISTFCGTAYCFYLFKYFHFIVLVF